MTNGASDDDDAARLAEAKWAELPTVAVPRGPASTLSRSPAPPLQRIRHSSFVIRHWPLPALIMLSLSNLHVSYDGSRILRGINLSVEPGKVVCLMGRNGVGKTTTLKAITGLVKPDTGSIKLGQTELTALKPDARARQGLGYVPQGRDIFPNLTVMENLRIGAVAQGKRLNGQVDRVFALFPILKDMTQRKGGVLSGGQQQQLAIGRALLTDPKVLLLDEPTEGIQPNIIDQIGETIKKLRSGGLRGDDDRQRVEEIGDAIKTLRREGRIGILLVEQYLDFCLNVGDSFYIMDRGAIVAEGPIAHLNDNIVKQHLTV
jgi:urea transport system ATP-binding protein